MSIKFEAENADFRISTFVVPEAVSNVLLIL